MTAIYPRDNALELARSEEIGVLAWKAGHGNETLTHPDQALLARSFLAVAAELEYRDQQVNAARPEGRSTNSAKYNQGEVNMEAQGIGWAIKQLHNGSKVRRAGWNGTGMWLMLVQGSHVQLREGTPYDKALNDGKHGQSHVSIGAHIDIYTAQGVMQPGWLASQADLLATDWEIAG